MSNHLIHSVAEATTHRDRDDLNQAIAQLVRDYFQATRVRLYSLIDEQGQCLAIPRTDLWDAAVAPVDDAKPVALTDDPLLADCVERRAMAHGQTPDRRARTIFPVESDSNIVSLLEIHTGEQLSSRDAILVTGLLRILKNHLGLLDYGERDTLTGLLNRKTFERAFEKLRARKDGARANPTQPGWFGVIDIDHFKSINDGFGHLFGDEVLLLVARLMQETFRGADQLFRFGGEEFVVILEGTSPEGARIAFERIRSRIEAHPFPQVGRVTISLGYTRIGASDASANCVERADAALYYAKQHGRNQVHCHELLVGRGELDAKTAESDIELF